MTSMVRAVKSVERTGFEISTHVQKRCVFMMLTVNCSRLINTLRRFLSRQSNFIIQYAENKITYLY